MALKPISVRVEFPSGPGDCAAVEMAGRLVETNGAEVDVVASVTEAMPPLAPAESSGYRGG